MGALPAIPIGIEFREWSGLVGCGGSAFEGAERKFNIRYKCILTIWHQDDLSEGGAGYGLRENTS